MSKITHSGLPWASPGDAVFAGKFCVAKCGLTFTSGERDQANAAYIVKACNAYPGLVEALGKVELFLNDSNDAGRADLDRTLEYLKTTVRSALASVEVKS